MAGGNESRPSNINQTMQLTLPANQAYDVLKNMLSCSAMFMMRRWNDEELSISFSSFDDVDLVAVIHEKTESECEVKVTSDCRDANRAVRRLGDFLRDYQAQIGMTSVQMDHERQTASRRADARKEAKHGSGSVPVVSELAQRVSEASLTTKILVGVIAFFIVIGLICGITSCGASSKTANDGKVAIPESSSGFEGENYKDVVTRLESAGFTNIETEGLGDLITGFLHKDGDVKTVSVNGSTSYSSRQKFSPDARIVIRYHSYSTSGESSSDDSDSEDSDSATQEKAKAETSDTEDNSSEPSNSSGSKDNASQVAEENITTRNNQEFAQILAGGDSGRAVEDFADKYQGHNIEFDGYTASVLPHGSDKTRFDYLILAGNTGSTRGPNFHFSDVNYYDLHLTGDNVPSSLTEGLNIHVVAEIGSYDSSSCLLELSPVSITMR